jgi:hypothetical protein
MRKRLVIGTLLMFSALILLTTCQFQFNKSPGNNVSLQIEVPKGVSSVGKTVAASARSLANGSSVVVTISQEGTAFTTQQTVAINGQSSIDVSFSLSATGTYDVTAMMKDAGGNTLAQGTTKLTVPAGNYPVVLSMHSSLLLEGTLIDSASSVTLSLSPFTFSYSTSYNPTWPFTLVLTTVDPQGTVSVTEFDGTTTFVDSPTGSAYLLHYNGGQDTVTIVVRAQDGSTQTYTITWMLG